MKTKLMIAMAALPLLFTACVSDWFAVSGSGNIVSEERYVSNFNSVELMSAADVEITKGADFKVEVSDYENLIQYISVKVQGNKLIIKNDPETVNIWNSNARVTITMPEPFYSARLGGSGAMKIDPAFTRMQSLVLTGSGTILVDGNTTFDKLDTEITGSGNIRARGTANALTTKISGSGILQLSDLKAYDAKCTLTGSGNTYVFVENKLDAYLTGSGNIIYSGNPTVNSYLSGSGRVFKR